MIEWNNMNYNRRLWNATVALTYFKRSRMIINVNNSWIRTKENNQVAQRIRIIGSSNGPLPHCLSFLDEVKGDLNKLWKFDLYIQWSDECAGIIGLRLTVACLWRNEFPGLRRRGTRSSLLLWNTTKIV